MRLYIRIKERPSFRIYLCYVTRGTRATRLEARGWVTIDDLWMIAERVWWLNGRATRRDRGMCGRVEYSRVQFRRISHITASSGPDATVLRACNGPYVRAVRRMHRCYSVLSRLSAIDRAKCAELTRRARDFVTTESSTYLLLPLQEPTNATRAVISRVNAT